MISLGGSKNRSKGSSTNTYNQTQTNTLSDRAAQYLNQGIGELQGMDYSRFDPASISAYESPYTQNVIDASLAQAARADAIARNQQMSDFGRAGAFGDDRRGIYEAELAGNQSRDRAELIAGLRDRAYTGARDIAVGENQNANQYELAIQQLLAQLRSQFANEGTQVGSGTSKGTQKGTNMGFQLSGSWSPAQGFNAG